jgi:hypothetical protein
MKNMKNLILIVIVASFGLNSNANEAETVSMSFVKTDTSINSSTNVTKEEKKRVTNTRRTLAVAGYSNEMMNDLFGDENFYFPTTEEKLEKLDHIIDLLIENDQYEESDKTQLLSLAKDAYVQFANYKTSQNNVQTNSINQANNQY